MRSGTENRKKEAGTLGGCEGVHGVDWVTGQRTGKRRRAPAGAVRGQRTLGDRVPRILITTFFLSWSTAT